MRYLIDDINVNTENSLLAQFWPDGEYENHHYEYVCKECGAELYSKISYAYCDPSLSDRMRYIRDRKEYKAEYERLCSIREALKECSPKAEAAYVKSINHLTVCPLCGAELKQEKGYFMCDYHMYKPDNIYDTLAEMKSKYGFWASSTDSPESVFPKLKYIREIAEKDEARTALNSRVQSYDLPAVGNVAKAAEIKGNTEYLKDYILHLIHLENNIYSLKEQLFNLYLRRPENARNVVFEKHYSVREIKTEVDGLRASYQAASDKFSAMKKTEPSVPVDFPVEPREPVLGRPGLFNKKKVLEANELLMKKYQADMETYQANVRRYEEEKARLIAQKLAAAEQAANQAKTALEHAEHSMAKKLQELEKSTVPSEVIKNILNDEITKSEELLKETFKARNELYAYDIIFEKYRDVVALSSFYEYLMSGRCTSLEGADGAYNIYENEIRANRVIAQLDTVISSLDDIKQNQYMMYQELRKINTSLQQLNSTMDAAVGSLRNIETNTKHISENSDLIAHNTAVTAYYSKVNAELTNALGYMVAFK